MTGTVCNDDGGGDCVVVRAGPHTNPQQPGRELAPHQQKLAGELQEQRELMVRAALRLGQSPQAGLVQHFLYR